jgi:hypothetical protein
MIKKFLTRLILAIYQEHFEHLLFKNVSLFDKQGKALKHLYIPYEPQIGSFMVFENNGVKFRYRVDASELTIIDKWAGIKLTGECTQYELAMQ